MFTEFVICFPCEKGINFSICQIVGLAFSEHFVDAEAALVALMRPSCLCLVCL